MLSSLKYLATLSFDGNIPHAVVRMKNALKKGGILNGRHEFNFLARNIPNNDT